MPDLNPLEIIKAAQTAAETECENLLAQLNRSEQFANDIRTKLVRAQGKFEAYSETLKTLESPAPPADAATAASSTETHILVQTEPSPFKDAPQRMR